MTNRQRIVTEGRLECPVFPAELEGSQINMWRMPFMSSTVHRLADRQRPIKLLEIGSWLGSSLYVWAEAIDRYVAYGGEILCVDPWKPYFSEAYLKTRDENATCWKMHQAVQDDTAYNVFKRNAELCQKTFNVPVFHARGISQEVLPGLSLESFDVVYIDGSHAYGDVLFDIEWAKRLVADGGFICGDDLEIQADQMSDLSVVHARSDDDIVFTADGKGYHPGVTRAVQEVFGPVSCYYGYWVMRRQGNDFVPVDLSSIRAFGPRFWGAENVENLKKVLGLIAQGHQL